MSERRKAEPVRRVTVRYFCDVRNCPGEMRPCQGTLHGYIHYECTVCHEQQWLDRKYPLVETIAA